MSLSGFNIYNASAGSGKTYTIVKAYLKLCFLSKRKYPFKYILAMTFTNKAVGEMKDRIVNTLREFADTQVLTNEHDMFWQLTKELDMSPTDLHEKAKLLLNKILHHYGAFDILTIDKFTQKLIRTFAFDLNVPINFEVEMDVDMLLSEAVDKVIDSAGSDKALTKTLVDFAIEKADDDKSWDVSLDFYKIAKLLISENDIAYINSLKGKNINDFTELKRLLKTKHVALEAKIVSESKAVIDLIMERGLDFNDFNRGFLPEYFKKLSEKNLKVSFDTVWQAKIATHPLYPKRVSQDVASIIDQIQPQIASAFECTKSLVFQIKFIAAFYKSVTPLSILNSVNKALSGIKHDRSLVLISEFNKIISTSIKNQPVPFIYERIGEAFQHYFIDEFQDTSVMQWENLVPLLDNALASEGTSVTLVGDAKQAIYRWRGGKAEQFIALNENENPFSVPVKKNALPKNFRSYFEVVNFNNSFFEFLSSFALKNSSYANLYATSTQEPNKNNGGYVDLSFLEIDNNKMELYPAQVLTTIKKCLEQGFNLSEICVITRTRKEGVAVANYLISEANISVVSSETLLISNSPKVKFIVNLLGYVSNPAQAESKIEVLKYLAKYAIDVDDKHDFYVDFIHQDIEVFFEKLQKFDIYFDYKRLLFLPLYEGIEVVIQAFNLVNTTDAYIQFFLDEVLVFLSQNSSNIAAFLSYYQIKKDKWSVVSPKGNQAIQIMTIHKSKGLEFPVVIYPFADLNIYKEIEPKAWLPVKPNEYSGFEYALLNCNKDFECYNEVSAQLYNTHQGELELDNLNLLYVVLTRAVEQLYIISARDKKVNPKMFSGLFVEYLRHKQVWDDSELNYSFGNPKRISKFKNDGISPILQSQFISVPKEQHHINIVTNHGFLWGTNQASAIEKGNVTHYLLSMIKYVNDIDDVFAKAVKAGFIRPDDIELLKNQVLGVVNHPELSQFYHTDNTIYNEKEIITKTGTRLRPDRLILQTNNQMSIIDYKTGAEHPKHSDQLYVYEKALLEMGFTVSDKILVYINNEIQIKYI